MRKNKQNTIKSILLAAVSLTLLVACSKKNEPQANRIVIWTSCSEFVQYVELFNKTHKDNRAILVYKENPALSIPPAKDEQVPDIIVGSWLRTDTPAKYYKSLDYIFDNKQLTSDLFYTHLLDSGKKRKIQYLLPVSFNLPAVIFSSENKDLVPDSYTLNLNQIRETGSAYNKTNKNGAYTRVGFTPLSNTDFLYQTTKHYDVDFHEEKGKIVWDSDKLKETTSELKKWVVTENGSAQTEEDFSFKYLFMPNYRQVTSGRTLYSYTTSDQLFKVMKEQNLDIDYRWIVQDKKIHIEDSLTMMGIYRKAKNQVGATEFISWFFQPENQQYILERKEQLNLETELFGISGGFSAVRDVTEHILPVYYTQLLTNLPPAQMLTVPKQLPARWESYKSMVVEPYIKAVVTSEEDSEAATMSELESEWRRKVFD